MSIKMCLVSIFVAVLFVGCGGDLAPQSEEMCPNVREQALSGGIPDETVDHRAVVYLGRYGEVTLTGACTGTFIAPDKVLTAAHCVCSQHVTGTTITAEECMRWDNFMSIGDYNEATHEFIRRGRSSGGGDGFVVVHPEFAQTFDEDGNVVKSTHDVAVLTLDQPAENIVSMAIADTAPELCVSVTIVGFGNNTTVEGVQVGHGVRREGSVVVTGLFPEKILTHSLADGEAVFTLHGDSGGPLLVLGEDDVERIAGVVSHGDHQNHSVCTSAVIYRDWIMAQ